MPDPLVQAPAEKLALLARLREQKSALEAARMAELDVFGLIDYKPHDKQQEFHDATESDVLYGGSAGGGKAWPSWPRDSAPVPATRAFVFC